MTLTPREKLQELKYMIEEIKRILNNRELLSYIVNKLTTLGEEGNISSIDYDKIFIVDKKSGDTFTLSFSHSEINAYYTCWNNHYRENVSIQIDGNKTTVKIDTATDYITLNAMFGATTARTSKTKVYVDNELQYVRKYKSTSENSVERMSNSTFESETHIKDKKAVKKITVTTEEDYSIEETSHYNYYESYLTDPFNNIDLPEQTYKHEPTTITEEQFNEFVNSMEETDTPQKK